MYRKIMGFLEAWKENEHRKPLILRGQGRWERHIPSWNSGVPTMRM